MGRLDRKQDLHKESMATDLLEHASRLSGAFP
jgi:hypothetical protein